MKEKNPKRVPQPIHSDPTVREARSSANRPDDGEAFVPERGGPLTADDAESFAEEYVASATTGQSIVEDARDEIAEEEVGGPFVEIESEGEEEEEREDEAVVTPRVPVPRMPPRQGR